MKVLDSFDKTVTEVLGEMVRSRLNFKVGVRIVCARYKVVLTFLKAHLDTYRFCDDVWTFYIKDVNFKLDNQSSVEAEKIKIVSCNSNRAGEQSRGGTG